MRNAELVGGVFPDEQKPAAHVDTESDCYRGFDMSLVLGFRCDCMKSKIKWTWAKRVCRKTHSFVGWVPLDYLLKGLYLIIFFLLVGENGLNPK